jgi:hypothetical protein
MIRHYFIVKWKNHKFQSLGLKKFIIQTKSHILISKLKRIHSII